MNPYNNITMLVPINAAAAGYINPNRAVDENADHRRMNDGVLHGQYTPKVYPFKDI